MGFFDGISLDDFKALEPAAPPAPGMLRSAADTGLSLARGAVQGVKMLSDATGAGNPVSDTLQRGIDWLSQNFSDYSQWEQLTSAQDQQAAALSGSTWEEIKAAARSFGKRPIDFLAEAAGTSIPTIAAAFLPGGQGAVLGRVAMLGMGAAQGAGSVKGQIFDEVEKAWKQAGATPQEAQERASAAQDYFGSNSGQIALGTALGAVAGSTGVEAGLLGKAAAPAAAKASIFERAGVPKFVREGAREAIPEAAQGGQETLAQNLALQNEGFDVGTMQGVVGNAVLEGLAGGAFGAAASPLHRERRAEAGMRALATGTTVDEIIAGADAVAESGLNAADGLSAVDENRAMSAMERQAAQDEGVLKFGTRAGPTPDLGSSRAAPAAPASAAEVETPPFSDRVLELRQQLADPAVRAALRAMDERAFSTVAQYASMADRPDLNMPEATRERLLSLAEGIVSRATLKPIESRRTVGAPPAAPQLEGAPAPQVPRIGLDTSPTGAIRVDSRGTAAPETRADAINTRQAIAPRQRPDGMTQQVQGSGRPRDFVLQGEGTLTPATRAPAPQLLLTADGYPYGTRASAQARATREGGTVVEVDGGFAVQKESTSAQPDMAGAAPGMAAGGDAARGDADAGQRAVRPGAAGPVRGPDTGAAPAGDGGRGPAPRGPDGVADAALTVGSTFELDGKQWTVTETTDRMVRASDGQGSSKIIARGSKVWQAITGKAETPPATSSAGGNPGDGDGQGLQGQGRRRQEALTAKNAEDRPATPVAESQAPAPSEPGDRGVAPAQDGGAPPQDRATLEAHRASLLAAIAEDEKELATAQRGKQRGDGAVIRAMRERLEKRREIVRKIDEKINAGQPPTLRDRVDAMRKPKPEPAPAADPDAFPTERLASLSDLTGRTRADVADQYTGLVREHGREKAGQMLDAAIETARKADTDRKAKAAAEEQARAEREAAEKAEAEERDRQRQAAERERAQREEDDRRREEEAQAAARAEEERIRRERSEQERIRAEIEEADRRRQEQAQAAERAKKAEKARADAEAEKRRVEAEKARERRDQIVALRRREVVLNKLLQCMQGAS